LPEDCLKKLPAARKVGPAAVARASSAAPERRAPGVVRPTIEETRGGNRGGAGTVSSFWHDIELGYQHHVVDVGKEQAFWVLVAFLATFLVVRGITHAIRAGRGPFRNVSVGGMHLHHLVPGIIIVLVTGYLSNAVQPRAGRTAVAILFGVGAALTLDEFALWLHLKDVYWQKQGRRSVDVVVIAATVAGLVVLGLGFWQDVIHAIRRHI